MTTPALPADFDPEHERDLFEIFSVMRDNIADVVHDFILNLFARIDQQQRDMARLAQPEPLLVLEQGIETLLQWLVNLFLPTSEGPSPPDDTSSPGEEDDPSDDDAR